VLYHYKDDVALSIVPFSLRDLYLVLVQYTSEIIRGIEADGRQ
jgi:hypothetical protein